MSNIYYDRAIVTVDGEVTNTYDVDSYYIYKNLNNWCYLTRHYIHPVFTHPDIMTQLDINNAFKALSDNA